MCRSDPAPYRRRKSRPAPKSFQAGRDIDGIADEVVALNYDVGDVDADPKPHLLTGRSISILLVYGFLHCDSTLHSIHGAGEVSDEAVARGVEDPTAMRGDEPIDDDPIRGEGAKGADLVEPHQSAVTFDIGGEDRGELPFDGMGFQPRHLPDRV